MVVTIGLHWVDYGGYIGWIMVVTIGLHWMDYGGYNRPTLDGLWWVQ